MAGSGVLRNPRHELYAQARASGMSMKEAYTHAGGTSKHGAGTMERNRHIKARVQELLRNAANRAQLSRRDILDRIFEDWELARKLGQVASALKAGELMGRELHKMFTERKEIGAAGDFDNKTEEELREFIASEMKDLGLDFNSAINPPDKIIN